jgi:hypothetical protein
MLDANAPRAAGLAALMLGVLTALASIKQAQDERRKAHCEVQAPLQPVQAPEVTAAPARKKTVSWCERVQVSTDATHCSW